MLLSVKSCFVGGEMCGSSGGRRILNFYYRESKPSVTVPNVENVVTPGY